MNLLRDIRRREALLTPGLADYSKVDILASRYKFVNFAGGDIRRVGARPLLRPPHRKEQVLSLKGLFARPNLPPPGSFPRQS